ncbi:biosynthetic arginine decarboxylase [Leisingera aquaemixtae]|uniref:biosynthetic arginine decarboxylase n=1 Tax=Leisingera aquaemixtae TaxID=1396826 RepID=UPI001C979352|nr:biosynthetic arginine decarboxylase [Leisingera aquaemixtae]MBY6068893.1 biosynthetic arginine decarboxylase [Leisingera aquaemixtae]
MSGGAETFEGLYGLDAWGSGMLEVTPDGAVALRLPQAPGAKPTPLPEVIAAIEARGISAPVVLRVQQFLEQSLTQLHDAFNGAIEAAGYKGRYRGVFPIKVNQQAEVIGHLMTAGQQFNYGLEAGSKPELMIALSQPLPEDALLICNGSKDEAFIRLAILSRKLGHNTVIVIETLEEFDIIRRVAEDLDIRPLLGVRVKLTERVTGKWQASSGDRSTFGLGAHDLVTLMGRLRDSGFLDCLVLQHSHLGSQVPNIFDIRRAADEACRFFVELTRMGAPLTHMDLGGGLGVDYTGARRPDDNSVNYTVNEYCTNIVETVRYALDEAGLPHPTIVTESGRFVVAHSSIFIFEVLGATLYDAPQKPEVQPDDHHLVSDLMAVEAYIGAPRFQEALNDAIYYRDELRALFRRGQIGLEQLSRAEQGFLYLAGLFKSAARGDDSLTEAASALGAFTDHYQGNFSLFQSLPDVWAIDQLHPMMPLQRLNEAPARNAMITDITCDSDGKLDHFILADGTSNALPVHDLREDEHYLIGVFFVGAYQETLGDLHNLFGDANVVTISLDGQGGFDIEHETEADTIAEVLSYVEYDPRQCLETFRKRVERAVKSGKVNAAERRQMIAAYKDSLAGSTYFD